jgi:transcription initiation factor IIE alpha subunit
MHNRAGRPGGAAIEAAQKKVAGAQQRTRANINIMPPDVVKKEIERLLANGNATEYLKKNVSKTAVEVISMLATPRTDEYLAEQLGMKINAVRRILNIMQGYGITNYYVSKNTKGWLSFAWYVNISKLDPFLERVSSVEKETIVVGEECNDYFICNNCYKNDKLVHTFDSAFELVFKCACGKSLSRMDRLDAEALINGEVNG